MHRIDTAGHVANRFSIGNPSLGQRPTIMGEDWPNAVQETICDTIEAAGLILDKEDDGQLTAAIAAMISGRIGNIPGFTQFNVDGALTASAAGKVIVLGGGGSHTLTLPASADMADGETFYFFAQGATWTIQRAGGDLISVGSATDSAAVTSVTIAGSDFCTISWRAAGAWIVTAGGPLLSRPDGILATRGPQPTAASAVGQWTPIGITTNLIYLPAGGTWAYFASNAGIGYAGVGAGTQVIFSGALNNAFGFCWRIA